ncbi:response regulator transcription factor [Streptomyces syringium]|uniref:response regulator transcription factor n=1 Tax=Streptomyces syringium TaxID=76729 RepID=UPI0033AFB33C
MHLSPKQEQILSLIVSGCCNKEIARQLDMSTRTVESHLQRLYDRHNVHNRAALVAKWLMEGGIPCSVPDAHEG